MRPPAGAGRDGQGRAGQGLQKMLGGHGFYNVPHPLGSGGSRFKAKLWLCEEHPLSLCEQVAPIIDLMAVSNALFAKLRDFITLRLPPGFPVKIGETSTPISSQRLLGVWGLDEAKSWGGGVKV